MLALKEWSLVKFFQYTRIFSVSRGSPPATNYQTVRLISIFGSGSCVFSFGSSSKVEAAAVSSFGLTQKWKLRTRFQIWVVSTFGPAQVGNGEWGMGSECQLFCLGHPVTFLGLSNLIFTKFITNNK